MNKAWKFLVDLDRRWLFALTFLTVGIPLLTGIVLPQRVSPMTKDVFNAIEDLPEGSKVLVPVDYDPTSEGELQPMMNAFVRHCAEKKHKIYFLTLWPTGVGMIQRQTMLLEKEYPDLKYGQDYVNLGYRPGYEGVIKLIVSDLPQLYDFDQRGSSVTNIPMMEGVDSIKSIPLIVNVSAGDPGLKQWVQYAAKPYDSIEIVGGTTGVQASSLYPYIPDQMIGMLAGLKPASEYELMMLEKYPHMAEKEKSNLGGMRMTSQETAQFMLIAIIILGNIVMWKTRAVGGRS